MLEQEFAELIAKIDNQKCEGQTIEVKAAKRGCPERLYDTLSSFSNQDEGGVIVFGIDEQDDYKHVGVYDAQDLQKKLAEVGNAMTPVVRPVMSTIELEGAIFVAAEIPPVDISDRPCFQTARGRLKGSYVRVGEADMPMTEYEVYSYEAYRKKIRDDTRPVDGAIMAGLDQTKVEQYLLRKKLDRPNLTALPEEQLHELTGITRDGKVTLAAIMLFSPWPQAFFPQLGIIATRVPGTEIGIVNEAGQRFNDSKRIEGTLPEMLDTAIGFVRSNMRNALSIDSETGKRNDTPEYPMDAVREVILNALVHRDYSSHTENMPIQLVMFEDRMEVTNLGGLYGRITVDQLGKVQPDTRNPLIITAMEAIDQTENRYSGIPRIRRAMAEAGLPVPVFDNSRQEFKVTLYNHRIAGVQNAEGLNDTLEGLIEFCATPRTRKEIAEFLGIATVTYAISRYVNPLVESGVLRLSIPDRPSSPKQTYQTAR